MNRLRMVALLGAVATSASVHAQADTVPAWEALATSFTEIKGEREWSGRLIAKPKAAAKRLSAMQAIDQQPVFVARHVASLDMLVLDVAKGPEPLGESERRVAEALMQTGEFEYVLPDWIVFPIGTPNDPRYGEQWHHQMMECEAAWDISVGNSDVIVAVVDTGIQYHVDLQNRVPGYNAVTHLTEEEGGDMTDLHGHGTHVAGCAAAQGNNGVGVSGMGWNLSVMPVRASTIASGSAYLSDLLEGAMWAGENGAVSVSVSFSGIGSQAHEDTGIALNALGCSLLWAAGNSATNLSGFDLPSVLVIGASDQSDGAAYFSSVGLGVDLFAPGVAILSTTNEGGYQAWNGTSMATPVANGALAMIRSVNPLLTPQQAEHVLQFSCTPWGGERNGDTYGFGRVNLLQALQMAQTAHVQQPPTAYPDAALVAVGASFQLDVLINDDDPNADPLRILSCDALSTGGESVSIRAGAGPAGRDVVYFESNVNSQPGVRTFSYEVIDDVSGGTSTGVVSVEMLLSLAPTETGSVVPGVLASYYEIPAVETMPDFAQLVPFAQETLPRIDVNAGSGNFGSSGRSDNLGVVIEGFLRVTQTGIYTFSLQSDDGSQFWIDDQLIIDHDGLHASSSKTGRVALDAGHHAIRVEYFEATGDALVKLSWIQGTQAIVPAPAFRRTCLDDCGGVVVAWGIDSSGQCAIVDSVQSIDAGFRHTAALLANGSVKCWGSNSYGQSSTPSDLGSVLSVVCGDYNTIALRTDGTIRGWGSNNYGQLNTPAGIGAIKEVAAAWQHTAVVLTNGSVRCWGWNDNGQCTVPADLQVVNHITAGDTFTVAWGADGSLRAWGDPISEPPSDLGLVAEVDAGYAHILAVQLDGTVRCWGDGYLDVCAVPEDLGLAQDVAAGGWHSVALLADGSVRAWGSDGAGQVSVPSDVGVVERIAAGGYHTLAVRAAITSECFGDIDHGGMVDFGDIALLLMDFGPCPECESDLDASGMVDFGDIALLALAFGPCE